MFAQLKDDQTVQNQYGYSPYGMTAKGTNGVVNANVDDNGKVSQYTSRENDGTGLYYYRARFYMPSSGRFISEDPIGLKGGMNSCAYVDGNPLSFNDPFGLDPAGTPGGCFASRHARPTPNPTHTISGK